MPVAAAMVATAAYGAYSSRKAAKKAQKANRSTVPDWLSQGAEGIIGGSGGMANLKDLLEGRGEISPAKRNFELAQSARGQSLEDRAIRGSAGRTGQGRTGALTGALVGSARNRARRDVGISARHTNEAEGRRREDMGQLWQMMNMYLGAQQKRTTNKLNIIATDSANKQSAISGAISGLGAMGGGGGG